jgi:copper homeostasis protein
VLIEVIVQTLDDAREAARGGADRLEVVRSIGEGGLTPPLSLVRAIAEETGLPLRVMVRENNGFGTNAAELPALRDAASAFASEGVDGLVIGFAANGQPDIRTVEQVLQAAPDAAVTFHRAFDALPDPLSAIDAIAGIRGVDRILTSGGNGGPASRSLRIRELGERAGDRLIIVAGGGVDLPTFISMARSGWVREMHVGRLARLSDDPDTPVFAEKVQRLRDLAASLAQPETARSHLEIP